MPATTAATENSEKAKPMRILPQYQVHCPGCNNGRSRITSPDAPYSDRVPCETCRPEDYRAAMNKRAQEGKK
jgi:hypothetical protein